MLLVRVVLVCTLWSCWFINGALGGEDDSEQETNDLFRNQQSMVHEIGPKWFNDHVDDLDKSTLYLVNFYSGSCGHCINFVETWNQVARYAKSKLDQFDIKVFAVNCDRFRDLCTKFQVDTTPKLIGFVPGGNPNKPETGKSIATEDLKEIKAWIINTISFHKKSSSLNAAKSQKRGMGNKKNDYYDDSNDDKDDDDGEDTEEEEEEEEEKQQAAHVKTKTVRKMSAKEIMKRDMAMAVRFGMESGVFLGRTVLKGEALQALYAWVNLLRQSFPGGKNRQKLDWLLSELKELEHDGEIQSEAFDQLLSRWDFAVYSKAQNSDTKWKPIWMWCKRRNLKDIGVFGGYPCALWTLFHTLTVSSVTGGASSERTLTAIYGFVGHFFSCNECRENFVRSNPDPLNHILEKAKSIGISSSRALIIWLWAEHNAVSRRLNKENSKAMSKGRIAKRATRRHIFPVVDQCRSCRTSSVSLAASRLRSQHSTGRTKKPDDMEYLSNQMPTGPNAQFRDVVLMEERQPENIDWDFDVLYKFLVFTYCFDDSRLRCPSSSSMSSSGILGGTFYNSSSLGGTDNLSYTFFLLGLIFAFFYLFHKKIYPIFRMKKRTH